tara:strand:+ start:1271 stop:3643 length:2373 start_codon:yes stop_codon:yes gene_type:complete
MSETQNTSKNVYTGTGNLYTNIRKNISNTNEFSELEKSLTMTEIADVNIIQSLIDSSDLIEDSERKSLEKYLRLAKKGNGKVEVKYTPANHGYGRFFAKGGSLQSFRREIRHTMAKDLYHDIDVVNAGPIMLYQYCLKHSLNVPKLKDYVDHRDERLQQIIEKCGVERWKAKQLMIRLMNLGSPNNWKLEWDVTVDLPNWVFEFQKEMQMISSTVYNNEEEIRNAVLRSRGEINKNKVASVISIMSHQLEHRVLMSMAKSFTKQKFKVDVLIFDGCMVRKDNEKEITRYILDKVENDIHRETGYRIRLEIKPMDEGFDLSKVKKDDWTPDPKYCKKFNQRYCSIIFGDSDKNTYERRKRYVELFLAKVISPQVCYIFKHSCKIDIYSKKDIINVMSAVMSGKVTSHGREIQFIEEWEKDPKQRIYERYEFIPFNEDLEEIDDDIYNLFQGFNKNIRAEYDHEKRDEIVGPFIELVNTQCEDNEKNGKYFLYNVSNMIKEPRKRSGICIIFKGKQGTGKTFLLDIIGRLLGEEDHYLSSSDTQDFFGPHAEGFCKKLLVNLNECEGKDTFNLEGRIKSFITDKTIILNPKNCRPTKINNYARTIVTTNKPNPLPIDVKSKDRRYVVFETSDKYLSCDKSWWKKRAEHFEKPEFISALYDYLMELDYSDIDWEKDRPITEAYKSMCQRYAPIEGLFIEDYLVENHNLQSDEEIKINGNDFYKKYMQFCIDNNFYSRCDLIPNRKKFKSSIDDLKIPDMEYKRIKKGMIWSFKIKTTYEYIAEKGWGSITIEK